MSLPWVTLAAAPTCRPGSLACRALGAALLVARTQVHGMGVVLFLLVLHCPLMHVLGHPSRSARRHGYHGWR